LRKSHQGLRRYGHGHALGTHKKWSVHRSTTPRSVHDDNDSPPGDSGPHHPPAGCRERELLVAHRLKGDLAAVSLGMPAVVSFVCLHRWSLFFALVPATLRVTITLHIISSSPRHAPPAGSPTSCSSRPRTSCARGAGSGAAGGRPRPAARPRGCPPPTRNWRAWRALRGAP